jgi:ribosomal protein S18 acetylase RimI-like enzyme
MIARIWRGAVHREDGDSYAAYMDRTGIRGYAETEGNRGAYMLRRDVDDRSEFVMVTFWESLDAVKRFAGDDYERAVFYPEDDRYLVERDLESRHFRVARAMPEGGRSAALAVERQLSATSSNEKLAVRLADVADAEAIGSLLHDFNTEYEDFTPGSAALAERMRELLPGGEVTVVLGGTGPDGIAVLRFRPGIWTKGLECYLAELYVAPDRRGQGLGRALLEAAFEVARSRGADHMDLGTSEDDTAARALYERLGFTNRERRPDGPIMYFYERDL